MNFTFNLHVVCGKVLPDNIYLHLDRYSQIKITLKWILHIQKESPMYHDSDLYSFHLFQNGGQIIINKIDEKYTTVLYSITWNQCLLLYLHPENEV